MQKYAKGIVAIIGAVLVSISAAYGVAPWLTVATAFVTSFGVYMVPNLPE